MYRRQREESQSAGAQNVSTDEQRRRPREPPRSPCKSRRDGLGTLLRHARGTSLHVPITFVRNESYAINALLHRRPHLISKPACAHSNFTQSSALGIQPDLFASPFRAPFEARHHHNGNTRQIRLLTRHQRWQFHSAFPPAGLRSNRRRSRTRHLPSAL
jgi:hypothetical protein